MKTHRSLPFVENHNCKKFVKNIDDFLFSKSLSLAINFDNIFNATYFQDYLINKGFLLINKNIIEEIFSLHSFDKINNNVIIFPFFNLYKDLSINDEICIKNIIDFYQHTNNNKMIFLLLANNLTFLKLEDLKSRIHSFNTIYVDI